MFLEEVMAENNVSNTEPVLQEPAHPQQTNQNEGIKLPLSKLVPGQLAKILRVDGNRIARLRFMEMGFIRGETVLVERVAPMGDPIEYRIKGYHISLRRADAQYIMVQPLERDSND